MITVKDPDIKDAIQEMHIKDELISNIKVLITRDPRFRNRSLTPTGAYSYDIDQRWVRVNIGKYTGYDRIKLRKSNLKEVGYIHIPIEPGYVEIVKSELDQFIKDYEETFSIKHLLDK